MNFLKELGFDVDQPLYQLAEQLVDEDYDLIEELVSIRRNNGMTLKAVAERTGGDEASISRFENHERDPHLSTIRAYAHAVRASIKHEVHDLNKEDRAQLQEVVRPVLKSSTIFAEPWHNLSDNDIQHRLRSINEGRR